jgi:hypothetical protein
MKTLKQILTSVLFALILGIPTYAGDMGGPSSLTGNGTQPTGTAPAIITTSPAHLPGDLNPPDLTVLALDFLVSALSMY